MESESDDGDQADNEQTVVYNKKVDPKLAGRSRTNRRKVQSSDEDGEALSAGEMDEQEEKNKN